MTPTHHGGQLVLLETLLGVRLLETQLRVLVQEAGHGVVHLATRVEP